VKDECVESLRTNKTTSFQKMHTCKGNKLKPKRGGANPRRSSESTSNQRRPCELRRRNDAASCPGCRPCQDKLYGQDKLKINSRHGWPWWRRPATLRRARVRRLVLSSSPPRCIGSRLRFALCIVLASVSFCIMLRDGPVILLSDYAFATSSSSTTFSAASLLPRCITNRPYVRPSS
jgi:hypothetical protein